MIVRSFFSFLLILYSVESRANSIGVSKGQDPDTFQKVVWKSIDDNAARLGLEVISNVAKSDPNLQNKQMNAFLSAGVDGVIASMSSSKVSASLVESARKAKKPLVFVNAAPPLDLLGSGVAYVGSDEPEAGRLQMTEVCRKLKGKGTVAILMGELSHPGARGRTTANHEVLKSFACNGIELLEEQGANWSRPQAREIVRTWLRAEVRPDAIVANNDDMALGAIDALKDAGVKGTIVAGVDATDEGLSAMQSGDLDVTVLQDARQQGEQAVAVINAMIAGQAAPSVTMVPFKLITPDSVAQVMRDRAGG